MSGVKAFLGASCIYLVTLTQLFGSFMIWANVCTYTTSYLRLHDPTVTLDDAMMILPLLLLSLSSVNFVGARLAAKYGVRL